MYKLEIHPFRVWFHLGCHASERAQVQPVDISVDIEFLSRPQGCISDELGGTVDYSKFIEAARGVAKRMEFALIEHLAHTLYSEFEKLVTLNTTLAIKVHKLLPPVDGMTNGVTFVYGK